MITKSYRELRNEYQTGVKELGAMNEEEKRSAKGLKLIKKIKVAREQIDQLALENQRHWLII